MGESKARAFVHFVWATKGRRPIIASERERRLYRVIEEQVNGLGCRVIAINGMPDHVHLLVQFGRTVTMAQVMKQAKGVASWFMNEWNMAESLPDDFCWQSGYGAFTLGHDQLQAPSGTSSIRSDTMRTKSYGRSGKRPAIRKIITFLICPVGTAGA